MNKKEFRIGISKYLEKVRKVKNIRRDLAENRIDLTQALHLLKLL